MDGRVSAVSTCVGARKVLLSTGDSYEVGETATDGALEELNE